MIWPDFYRVVEKLFLTALTFILHYRYILLPHAVGHNCNTRGYIHCIKCWVKSFNLAIHIFFFLSPKLHNSVDKNTEWWTKYSRHIYFSMLMWNSNSLSFYSNNIWIYIYLLRMIDKHLFCFILIGFTTSTGIKNIAPS